MSSLTFATALLANLNSFSGASSEWTISRASETSKDSSITKDKIEELKKWLETKDLSKLPRFVRKSLRDSGSSFDLSKLGLSSEEGSDVDLGEVGDIIKKLAEEGRSRERKVFKRSTKGSKRTDKKGARKGKKVAQPRDIDPAAPKGWSPDSTWTTVTWKR